MNKSLMRDIFSLSVISSLLLNFPAHTQNNIVNKWNAGEGSDASGDASTAAGVWVTSTEYGATFMLFGTYKWFDFEVMALEPLISNTWLNILYILFGVHGGATASA